MTTYFPQVYYAGKVHKVIWLNFPKELAQINRIATYLNKAFGFYSKPWDSLTTHQFVWTATEKLRSGLHRYYFTASYGNQESQGYIQEYTKGGKIYHRLVILIPARKINQ